MSPGLVFLGCEEVDWEEAPVLGEKCCTAKLAPKGVVEHGTISLEEWLEVHGPITRPGRCIPCEGWQPEDPKDCRLLWTMDRMASNEGRLELYRGKKVIFESRQGQAWCGYPECGPESQCIQCLGPIPAGRYKTGGGWFYRKTWRLRVQPPDDLCAGRSGFQIHGGNRWSSRGCIVLKHILALKDKLDKDKDKECEPPVTLIVRYAIGPDNVGACTRHQLGLEDPTCLDIHVTGTNTCAVGCAPRWVGDPVTRTARDGALVQAPCAHAVTTFCK